MQWEAIQVVSTEEWFYLTYLIYFLSFLALYTNIWLICKDRHDGGSGKTSVGAMATVQARARMIVEVRRSVVGFLQLWSCRKTSTIWSCISLGCVCAIHNKICLTDKKIFPLCPRIFFIPYAVKYENLQVITISDNPWVSLVASPTLFLHLVSRFHWMLFIFSTALIVNADCIFIMCLCGNDFYIYVIIVHFSY